MTLQELGEIDWLKQWARLSPRSLAFKDGDSGTTFSYDEIYRVSSRLASYLAERFSIQKGDRIALLATNEIETVVLFFASFRLGSILVPANFRLTGREIDHILTDSGASLLVAQKALREKLTGITFKTSNLDFEDLQSWIAEALRAARKDIKAGKGETARELAAGAHDPCMILYTSGTTGAPKGALITPKMLHWNSLNTTLRLNVAQSDVFVSFLPFFHTGGWNVLLTPFVHRGAATILTKRFDAEKILALCESEGATIMFGVPTTMEMMSRSPNFARVNLSKVRYAIVGGEPMPIELIHTWQKKGVPIRQGFGLTEFGPNVFSLNEEDALRKIGSIGFPNFYVETRIVDDQGEDVEPGKIGELILRGPVCTPGYWKNPQATGEAIREGWFHTGDLVRVDGEGYYYVAGRKKDMFISGGENVYPVEVERVLSQHPAIREVAVIGIPDSKWGEVGRAYIALDGKQTLSSEDVFAFCGDKLAKFKIPKEVRFLDSLPKGDSGKILKRHLPQ